MCNQFNSHKNRPLKPFKLRYILFIASLCGKSLIVKSFPHHRRQQQTLESLESLCFGHDSCPDLHFCAWVQCRSDDGNIFDCGRCLPCSMCLCNSNATDFQCPQNRCPKQPTNGVLFWQGAFYNVTTLQDISPSLCVRRLLIQGNTFLILQVQISNSHPASSGTLTLPSPGKCPGMSRSGVLILSLIHI